MRVYLSGPMTGMLHWNYPAFLEAAKHLRALGHTVYNPADSSKPPESTHRAEFLRDDLHLLAGGEFPPAEAIALLPGWEASGGARMELTVSIELGLVVFAVTPSGVVVLWTPEETKAKLLDAIVSAWAPKHIELVAPAAESILQEAQRLVHGDRGADYGHPLEDFTRTAALATAQFRDLLRDDAEFTYREVWQFMCLVKLSRERNRPKRDNRTDIAGYAETGQMCEEETTRRAA